LYRLHPQLRFAWVGRERAHSDELNAGSFALVQLYHVRDSGTPDYPHSYREFYEVGFAPDTWGAPVLQRIHRGPIFSKDGVPGKRDWDPLVRNPMLISVLDAYELQDEDAEPGQLVTHYDVFSGRVVNTIRQWLLSPYERYVKSAKAKGRTMRNTVEDIAAEASSELWKSAQKSDQASVTLSKKHAKEDIGVQQLENWKDKGGTAPLEDFYMPPPPPKAS
jgi:hypothetical protein